jgi:hypothetical protein
VHLVVHGDEVAVRPEDEVAVAHLLAHRLVGVRTARTEELGALPVDPSPVGEVAADAHVGPVLPRCGGEGLDDPADRCVGERQLEQLPGRADVAEPLVVVVDLGPIGRREGDERLHSPAAPIEHRARVGAPLPEEVGEEPHVLGERDEVRAILRQARRDRRVKKVGDRAPEGLRGDEPAGLDPVGDGEEPDPPLDSHERSSAAASATRVASTCRSGYRR